jgi:hypothetical protein
MPYLGNTAGNRFVAPKAATQFSGDGSTTAFTLDHAVGSDEDILVSVDGVIQEPSVAYAVSNGTTLTFTAAPSNNSGNNIFVYYLFRTVGTVSHPSNNALTATNATLTGNATISGTLGVTGATTLSTKLATSNLGAGAILQAVQFRSTTYQTTTSTDYVNYSHTNATITPSSTSNKVLVLSSHNTEVYQNNSYSAQGRYVIYRGGSAVSEENYIRHYDYGGSGHLGVTNSVINFLDSPSSTSSVSYQLYMKLVDGDGAGVISGSITLLEIAA